MSQPRTTLAPRRCAGFHLGVRRSWPPPPTAAATFHCLGGGHKQVNLNTLDYIYPLKTDCYPESRLMGKLILQRLLYVMEAWKRGDGRRERRPSLPVIHHMFELFRSAGGWVIVSATSVPLASECIKPLQR